MRDSKNSGLLKKIASWAAQQAAWKLLLWALGGGIAIFMPALLFLIVIAVIVNLTGSFFLGALTGVHFGDPAKQTQWTNQDAQIKQTYKTVAQEWKNGLDSAQQQIVESYQVYMPTSVLLTLGKFVDNYQAKNQQTAAQNYYDLLTPQYTWAKGQGETITKDWAESCSQKKGCHRYIATSIQTFTVWELRKAVVWDGTFTSQWGTKTIGTFSPSGTGTKTTEPVMSSEHMAYNWGEFYAAAAKYKFKETDVNPLWFDAIYAMQWTEYQAGNPNAYLKDPNVDQWGPVFGQPSIVIGGPVGTGHVANPAQVNAWVGDAITLDASYGMGASWASTIVQIIGIESGGNPLAYNPDAVEYYTNPPVYEHAEGIMQTMPSTFKEYALPGHTDIWNPVDNIAAAMRYIKAGYGNPQKALNSESTGGY